MTDKRFILVTGPEGSGTYMMAEALVSCGLTEVIRGAQTYNTNYAHLIPDMPDLIFTHRSLPAAGIWPDLEYMKRVFYFAGYDIHIIFMMRDVYATLQSQEKRNCIANKAVGFINVNKAYQLAFAGDDLVTPVSYEAFVNSEGFRRWLFIDYLKLPMPTIEVRDENKKYYE